MTDYSDSRDPFDDTPEGDWRPPQRPRQADFRSSQEYKVLREQFITQCRTHRNSDGSYGLHCWLCYKPINYSLKWPNPWAPTADHVIPARLAPERVLDVTNWRPAHRQCNESRSRKADDTAAAIGTPSESW